MPLNVIVKVVNRVTQLLVHANVKLVSLAPNVIKNVIPDSSVSVAYKNVSVKMGPIVMSNLERVSAKLVGTAHIGTFDY